MLSFNIEEGACYWGFQPCNTTFLIALKEAVSVDWSGKYYQSYISFIFFSLARGIVLPFTWKIPYLITGSTSYESTD